MNEPTNALIQFVDRIKGTATRNDVRRILTAIEVSKVLPDYIKDAAMESKSGMVTKIPRSYICTHCGQSFVSDQEEYLWLHTLCPECKSDEKAIYYGHD